MRKLSELILVNIFIVIIGILTYDFYKTNTAKNYNDIALSTMAKVVLVNVVPSSPENYQIAEQTGATASGTGIFVHQDEKYGYVLTNRHVIESKITLEHLMTINIYTVDRPWTYTATIVAVDKMTDLALLRVEKQDKENWIPFEWNLDKNLPEGKEILAIGHGANQPYTVTYGRINSIDRFTLMPLNFMLQHDAVINLGNSGGPVVDMDGKLLGINTIILSPNGIGRRVGGWDGIAMAVNAWQAKRSVDIMLQEQTPKYVQFDFEVNNITLTQLDMVDPHVEGFVYRSYAIVSETEEHDNIKDGDIIFEADGEKVWHLMHFVKAIIDNNPGDVIKIKVLREGKFITVDYKLSEFIRK